MLVLFVLHGLGNSCSLLDVGYPISKAFAHLLVALCCVHAVLGIILTVDAVVVARRTHAGYGLLNARFWASRISGLAICVFIFTHTVVFQAVVTSGAYRLRPFDNAELALSLGLVVSMLVHIIVNARPLMIALGLPMPRARAADLALALSVLCLIMALSFAWYWRVWSVF